MLRPTDRFSQLSFPHRRTRRVFLHSLDDVPHAGCGCFRLILFKTDKPREGIGITERDFPGLCPDSCRSCIVLRQKSAFRSPQIPLQDDL